MTTPSNTLPAIRVLLWERWRQSRWVFLVIWGVYGLFYFVYWADRDYRPPPNYSVIEGIHLLGLPVLIMLAIVGISAYAGDGRNFSFRMPGTMLRLPLSTLHLATVQLVVQLISVLILSSGMLIIDYLLFREDALVFRQPTAHFLIALLIFATLLKAWLTYLPHTVSAAVALPAVAWAAGLLPRWAPEMRTLPELSIALLLAAALSVLALHLRRSHWAPGMRTLKTASPVISWPAATIPREWGAQRALIWYEWRSWGWIFVAVALLAAPIPSVLYLMGAPIGTGGAGSGAIAVWFTMAMAIGVFGPLREGGRAAAKPSDFCKLRPVDTYTLAKGRLLGTATVLLATASAMLIGMLLQSQDFPFPVMVVLLGGAIMLTWVMINAIWPLFILYSAGVVVSVLIQAPILAMIRAGQIAEGETLPPRLDYLPLQYLFICFALGYMAFHLARWRVMPWGRTMRWALASAVAVTAYFLLYLAVWELDEGDGMFSLLRSGGLFFLAIFGPFLWQVYWIHRCRHGGPPNYRGYAKT